ncbi:MAG: 7-carboxy-7-deazaguanine synthase [Bacteroidota bacterium]
MYKIKEIYYTIQGEGANAGSPAVFCRFAGCNLWSGREEDRHKAICNFCDTNFFGTDGVNGGSYTAESLVEKLLSLWPNEEQVMVVCTGGEPMLQLDEALIDLMHAHNIFIAIETNGTMHVPDSIDWICVSPKADTEIVQTKGHELKLVYPQIENKPSDFEQLQFDHFYLQPLDNSKKEVNTYQCMQYCLENPKWKLSLQIHKYLGIE